jgi:hypothetical protein
MMSAYSVLLASTSTKKCDEVRCKSRGRQFRQYRRMEPGTADVQADIPRSEFDTLLAERIRDQRTRTDVSTHCADWSCEPEVGKDTTYLGAMDG